jgi:hypothetical protein
MPSVPVSVNTDDNGYEVRQALVRDCVAVSDTSHNRDRESKLPLDRGISACDRLPLPMP